ncbi:hypothetical protein HY632_03095 [Candidatus Uhrbacteria bacterium]|nr:hypothetical protein [Candidatus Uhrbacteria bacterium]
MADAPLTRDYFDQQFDTLTHALQGGFAHIDREIIELKTDVAELKTDVAGLKTDVAGLKTDVAGLKTDVAGLKRDVGVLKMDVADMKADVADLKSRMAALEDEVRVLSANMVTKQYLDAKLDIFIRNQERDSLFKRTLLLALEQAKVLDPAMRAKLEQLIPS